jgi:malate synthase
VFAAYQKEEILFALRDYIVGLNCGWHDYMASIGAVHQNLPSFTMAPKSNLRSSSHYIIILIFIFIFTFTFTFFIVR